MSPFETMPCDCSRILNKAAKSVTDMTDAFQQCLIKVFRPIRLTDRQASTPLQPWPPHPPACVPSNISTSSHSHSGQHEEFHVPQQPQVEGLGDCLGDVMASRLHGSLGMLEKGAQTVPASAHVCFVQVISSSTDVSELRISRELAEVPYELFCVALILL